MTIRDLTPRRVSEESLESKTYNDYYCNNCFNVIKYSYIIYLVYFATKHATETDKFDVVKTLQVLERGS